MPISREEHEELLNELNNPELDHSKRTDILTTLRTNHVSDLSEFEEKEKMLSRYKKDNEDLVLSNSKLFRSLGMDNSNEKEEVKEKEFSETVTASELLKNAERSRYE